MTRGSFEAWMKRLVCLWGVWCRLKESPRYVDVPMSGTEREREREKCAIWELV